MTTRLLALVLLPLFLTGACASAAQPQTQTGDGAELTFDGLQWVGNTIMNSVWARPDIDLRGFDKVIFVPIGVSYRVVEPSDPTTALRRSTRSRDTDDLAQAPSVALLDGRGDTLLSP